GDMQGQLVRLDKFGGMRTKKRDIEKYLVGIGAVDPSTKRSLPGEGDEESEDDERPTYFDLGKSL
ncbi:hypothetical protein GGF43_003111, partial [Coemansia sp. RSA 2618]